MKLCLIRNVTSALGMISWVVSIIWMGSILEFFHIWTASWDESYDPVIKYIILLLENIVPSIWSFSLLRFKRCNWMLFRSESNSRTPLVYSPIKLSSVINQRMTFLKRFVYKKVPFFSGKQKSYNSAFLLKYEADLNMIPLNISIGTFSNR